MNEEEETVRRKWRNYPSYYWFAIECSCLHVSELKRMLHKLLTRDMKIHEDILDSTHNSSYDYRHDDRQRETFIIAVWAWKWENCWRWTFPSFIHYAQIAQSHWNSRLKNSQFTFILHFFFTSCYLLSSLKCRWIWTSNCELRFSDLRNCP